MSRRVLLVASLAALVCFAGLSVQVYRSKADPESFATAGGSGSWLMGQSYRELNRVAAFHLDEGMRGLSDESRDVAERAGVFVFRARGQGPDRPNGSPAIFGHHLVAGANTPQRLASIPVDGRQPG